MTCLMIRMMERAAIKVAPQAKGQALKGVMLLSVVQVRCSMDIPKDFNIKYKLCEDGAKNLYWRRFNRSKLSLFRSTVVLFGFIGMWCVGLLNGLHEVMQPAESTALDFLIVWLIVWCFFGLHLLAVVYLNVRPQKAESLMFHHSTLDYDAGTEPPVDRALRQGSLFGKGRSSQFLLCILRRLKNDLS